MKQLQRSLTYGVTRLNLDDTPSFTSTISKLQFHGLYVFVLLVKSTLSLLQKQTQLHRLLEITFTSIHYKSALHIPTYWIPKEPEESSESETSVKPQPWLMADELLDAGLQTILTATSQTACSAASLVYIAFLHRQKQFFGISKSWPFTISFLRSAIFSYLW